MTPKYGTYDGYACRWTHSEAWILVNDQWRKISPTEAVTGAGVLSEQAYARLYSPVPPMPKAAFQSSE